MINAYAVGHAGGELSPFQYDPGELGDAEVELEVLYAGLCHTDLGMIDNAWGFTQYPLVPGHEIVGRIAKVGPRVRDFVVGQLVGLGFHSGYCGTCGSCSTGDHNLCPDAQMVMAGRHGGFADKVRAAANSIIPIPDAMDPAVVGPLFCAGITVFNPFVQFGISPSDHVAIIGIGGLGHLALQVANAWGCEVTAFTTSDRKAEEARSLGAHQVLNSRSPEQIASATSRFDLVLSTVEVGLDWRAFLQTLKPKGRLNFVGASTADLGLTPMDMMSGQLSISGSMVGSPPTMVRMLDFFQRHKISPVVEYAYFDEINSAVEKLRRGDVYYRIVLKHRR